ncbi:MAG: YidC/Oxa1 family membrane protein insertase [Dehalococcoidia bacterium]|nr:YidC/Oxa1 family membrane protein insertase [Dehalococcoidia bacterium]
MDIIGIIWNFIILRPMTNVMIALSHFLGNNFGLSIIVLTLLINLVTYPLTLRQMKSSKAMQDLQPKLAELQRKYAKDPKLLGQEQMRLYREAGVNPAGCLLPMLLPMPIWIALYQTIRGVMATTPENFLGLSGQLYHWSSVYAAIPLNTRFLWLNLGASDMLLAILVGVSMWLQQKMVAQQAATSQAAQQTQMMQMMMPIVFGFIALSVPSGLALYWVVNSIIRIAVQYFFSGWGGLSTLPRTLMALWPMSPNSIWRRPARQVGKK